LLVLYIRPTVYTRARRDRLSVTVDSAWRAPILCQKKNIVGEAAHAAQRFNENNANG
jgi:hypothetical protein